MPSRNLLLLPHYPKNRPEAAPRVSNGSAWRLAAGSGDYCGAESPSLGFVGLGSARAGTGSGARATGMPFRLVVRGMFPETSSRTAGPVAVLYDLVDDTFSCAFGAGGGRLPLTWLLEAQ